MTVRDLLNSSAAKLGILGTGETLSANEATSWLNALNAMVDTWSNESLLVISEVEESFPLISGQQSYTMGPSGNFNTTRPQLIRDAVLRTTADGVNMLDLPLQIITVDEWAAIGVKSTPSSIPTKLYVENSFPLANLHFYPVPNMVQQAVFWSWKPIASFAALSTTLSLAPGYLKAMIYNLALEMGPEYNRMPSDLVVVQATASKGAIKRMNSRPRYMSTDAALVSKRRGYNIITGD